MAVSLPQDVILFQIITRVPTKSVVRFKCVSKQWNSFLMSDRFKEMHNDFNILKGYVDSHLEDCNLFFLSEKAATFYTIDCESPPDNAPCSRPLPQFTAHLQYMLILTSFRGLVCLGIKKYVRGDFDIVLWNPVTTEYKRLSKPSNPDHMECYKYSGTGYGLYYCSGEDDYKLLVVTKYGNAYMYSLKSDSWRKLDTKLPFPDFWSWRSGFCLNQYLYFLCDMDPDILNEWSMSMRFDTKAKRFHKIKPPPVSDSYDASCSTAIIVHKGSIHLCAMYGYISSTDCTRIKLWKFIADEDIWRKVITYQLLLPNHDILELSPLHLMSNGNLLMIVYNLDGGPRICQVDLKKKKYTKDKKNRNKSKDKNKSKGNFHDEYKLLYYSDFTVGYYQEVIYTETFVSPNRYTLSK